MRKSESRLKKIFGVVVGLTLVLSLFGIIIIRLSSVELESSSQQVPRYSEAVYIYDEYAYLATDEGFGIVPIIEPSNLGNPAYYETNVSFREVSVYNNFAYLLGNGGRLYIFNISDPSSPMKVTSGVLRDFYDEIFVQGNTAYLITGSEFVIMNVTNPFDPNVISQRKINGARKIFISNQIAYIAFADESGETG